MSNEIGIFASDFKGEIQVLPDRLDSDNLPCFLRMSPDKLRVWHQSAIFKSGTVRSEQALPLNSFYYYFEVMLHGTVTGEIRVGFESQSYSADKKTEQTINSYGISSDGNLYHNNRCIKKNKSKIKHSVGCGIIFNQREIFFTIDGVFQEHLVIQNIDVVNYPAVTLSNEGNHIEFNFGEKPFKCNVDPIIKLLKQRFNENVMVKPNLSLSENLTMSFVSHYLLHHCYDSTYKALVASDSEFKIPETDPHYKALFGSLSLRKQIMQCIRSKDFSTAIRLSGENFPNLSENVLFALKANLFIKKLCCEDRKKAITFAFEQLQPFTEKKHCGKYDIPLREVMSFMLLAASPENLQKLAKIQEENLEGVAQLANQKILKQLGVKETNPLELMLKQTSTVDAILRANNAFQGLPFRLSDFL